MAATNRNYYYTEGNTVRRYAAPEPVHKQPEIDRETQMILRHADAAVKNRENARAVKMGFMVFFSVAVIMIAAFALTMVQTQASITSRMRQVAELESQITQLRAENDAKFKEINTSVDLEYIKNVAIQELGMTYATEEQIVYYSIEQNNYMDQYADIPQ